MDTRYMDGTDALLVSLAERFVVSFEKLATAIEGINETYGRSFAKQYPEPRQAREAVVTRVPTEEDRLREAQGASLKPIADWLGELEDSEEDIGARERQWLEAQKRHAGS